VKPSTIQQATTAPLSWPALQHQVEALTEQCFSRASRFFRQPLKTPPIRFDLRGASAGQAVFRRQGRDESVWIRFNATLLQQNPQEFFSQVVAHEAAHVIAHYIYGRSIRPHGPEWQRVMREVLGVAPQVRHRMDVRQAARRTHRYGCGCESREHALSSIRHNRIVRQQQVYLCRACRLPLKYLGS